MSMNKKIIVLAVAVSMMFGLAACGGKQEAAPAAAGTGSSAAAGAASEVKIVASNFKFDQAEYKVKKGSEVKVSLENKEGIHGIEVKGLDVKLQGQTMSKTFKADKAGTYEIICNVPCGNGHLTMKAKLIVEA